jgi:PAS domain S-box-containing protein
MTVVGQDAPREAEDRYRLLFEQSPLPMWMYDRDTLAFVAVNEAAVQRYGYSREEFAAMTIADIRPPEDVDALKADVRQATGFQLTPAIWRHKRRDGSIMNVEVTASDLTFDGRNVRLVLVNDVTERERAQRELRRTEEQLRHAQKMDAIGRLAGGVAHDMNNVLTVILSYADLVADNLDESRSEHQDVVEIRRAAERGSAITRQLLALSRHSASKVATYDLGAIVGEFVPMLRRLLGEQIEIVVHRSDAPMVLADRSQLEQVLLNLGANARDAMSNSGTITIETHCVDFDDEAAQHRGLAAAGRYVTLSVTDTGIGISPENQRRLFEPFFTTKPQGKGTGLGLSIIHGIVTQAGGVITVYSELGHGTTFRVYLPATAESIQPEVRAPITVPTRLPAVTVLVVDDDGDVRAAAARVLRDAGCVVLDASTGEEARQLCVSHDGPIHLVVLDVVLPDARGDLLVDDLRRIRPALDALLMSGYPAGALAPSGATPRDLLTKPFSPSELRAAVARRVAQTVLSDLPPRQSASGRHPRVLIVDDDESVRRTLTRLLRRASFDVEDAATGASAIEKLSGRPFDVIISDIQMPDGDGIALLRAVRRIDLDVPVLLITGEPDVQSAAAAVELGAFRFLTKPFDNEAIVRLVQRAARANALARVRRDAFSINGGRATPIDRAGLEERFDSALQKLWMAHQPIVDARTGITVAFEALVRSDETSMATPDRLLETATELGMLAELGRRIRGYAATSLASHPEDVDLYVNLHPDDLLDADLVDQASPLTLIAHRVVLEITERASLRSSALLLERIARIRELGFRIAVDDIGAGYSGLTSFAELEPHVVKIDMSLVRDVHHSTLKQRTITSLCNLCHDSGARVVGEGVETEAERQCLVSLGCDLLQGYLLGKPARPA